MKNLAPSSKLAILADALDTQARALAAAASAIREHVSLAPAVESKFYDQHTSPLSKRVFLLHARQEAFPTRRVGKRVLVERDVFDRWLTTKVERRRTPPPPPSGSRSIDDDVLDELNARAAGGSR